MRISHTVYRRDVDTKQLGDVLRRLSFSHQSTRQGLLLRTQLGGTTKAHAPSLRRYPSHSGTFTDQIPLKLCEAGKHGQNELPDVRRCVGPGFSQRLETCARRVDPLDEL